MTTSSFQSATAAFGTLTLTNAGGGRGAFLACLDGAGAWTQALPAGAAGSTYATAIALASSGVAMLVGYFSPASTAFGALVLPTSRTAAAFATQATGLLTPACVAAGGLAAGAIVTTGAQVSFTPDAGTVAYTLTYTPAGGATQTIANATSPFILSGLAPGTTYTVNLVGNCGAGVTIPEKHGTLRRLRRPNR